MTNTNKPTKNQQTVNPAVPIRIKIPNIHVDAVIQNVGITANGAMDVPSNITDVGLYKFGPIPGNKGSAVIAGHLDGKNGESGVFALLHILNPGDKVYIEVTKGMSTSFTVRETRIYNPKEDTSDVFNQSDGSHLNLITCDGAWDNSQQSYTKRIVVFTDISH